MKTFFLRSMTLFLLIGMQWCRATTIHEAARYNDKNTVEQLLKAGISANEQDHKGNTPLHYIAEDHHYDALTKGKNQEVAKLLISHGGNVNIPNKLGKTPFFEATCKKNEPLMLLFIEHGLNIEQAAQSPLYDVTKKGLRNAVHALLNKISSSKTKEYIEAYIDQKSRNLRTPLFQAARHGDFELVKKLIDMGANVKHQDRYGNTALHEAGRGLGYQQSYSDSDSDAEVTPFEDLEKSYKQTIDLLIQKGLKPDCKNKAGATPSDLASKNKRTIIQLYFLEQYAC